MLSNDLKLGLFLLCITCAFQGHTQEHAWVYFNQKENVETYLENPLSMLGQKALDRRERQGIALDFTDVPIPNTYVSTIDATASVAVKAKSKWLNAVHVVGERTAIQGLTSLAFVQSVSFAGANPATKPLQQKKANEKFEDIINFSYGPSANQIEMINLDYLHQEDLTGQDMTIAVMDAGFPNVDVHEVFKRLRETGRLKGGYDFVHRSPNFYTGNSHGSSVLSIMGGYAEGALIGTAPDANYYLFITEDVSQETPLEESLWVEAAERADSLGVDIINTSLGYSTFDDARYNYSYADMDGKTTFISRGATLAFTKGIILVNSAGNEGNKTWRYITAPADATNVLAIGAVTPTEEASVFSSFGPNADGEIKPDVSAQGTSTSLVNSLGNVTAGNGTSFSGPVIAGAVACLWQGYSGETNLKIVEMIRQVGDRFENPSDQLGYGIPDFKQAFLTLSQGEYNLQNLRLFPNPVEETLFVELPSTVGDIRVYDLAGRLLLKKSAREQETEIAVGSLVPGIYFLQVNQQRSYKFIKN